MARIIKNEDLDPEVLDAMSQDMRDWIYNALDVCVTLEVLERQLESVDAVAAKTYNFSRDLMGPILEMNLRGTLVDLDQRQTALAQFRSQRDRVERNLTRILSEGIRLPPTFNYRSTHQLKQLFYSIMDLKPIKARNANGVWAPTVNRDALEKLERYFMAGPLCRHILLLREYDKKIQFIDSEIDSDGRMRTSYNIAGTNTGRLSSSESDFGTGTNQQNIERPLRQMFIPDEGMKFCNIDLEQADARHVGAICWELFVEEHGSDFAGSYLDACESGDLHTTVCRMAWQDIGWPSDRAGWRTIADGNWYRDFSYRDGAKKLGHGTNYYGTPRTMAGHTKVEIKVIEEFQERYFEAFPVLGSVDRDFSRRNWHSWVHNQIDQFGYITTPFYERRRFFFGRPDDPRTLREAIAYAPQSMTADAIDTALIRIWKSKKVDVLIQVHDSILFQYPIEHEATIIPEMLELATIQHTLKHGRKFSVPAEAKIGYNWADFNERTGDNPAGLIKWKGANQDLRERPAYRTGNPYTLAGVLGEKTSLSKLY